MMFNLSIFDCCTESEKKIYRRYKKSNKPDEKQEIKKELLENIKSYSGIRKINKNTLFDKNDKPIIDKMIAGFENECVRLSESFVYNKDSPKDIPLIKEIVILDCPGTADKNECSWHEIVLSQLIENGVLIDGEKYIIYSNFPHQKWDPHLEKSIL